MCDNLLRHSHLLRTPDGDVELSGNEASLENLVSGMTREERVTEAPLDSEGFALNVHLQMLVRVVCFCSHRTVFRTDVARYVYYACFPNSKDYFVRCLEQLIELGVLLPVEQDFMADVLRTDRSCEECSLSYFRNGWQTPRLQGGVHEALLGLHAPPERDCGPPSPPSRTNWTRLVPPPVLIGHVSSLPRRRVDVGRHDAGGVFPLCGRRRCGRPLGRVRVCPSGRARVRSPLHPPAAGGRPAARPPRARRTPAARPPRSALTRALTRERSSTLATPRSGPETLHRTPPRRSPAA